MKYRESTGRPWDSRQAICSLLLALAIAQAVFAAAPGIDLVVSGLFFDPERGFWLAGIPALIVVRTVLRAWVWVLAVPVTLILTLVLCRRLPLRLGARPWIFTLACLGIGPGLIVNVLLKDHWGRARPADILQFGATARFTPAFQITDQCGRNCSFTSGEAATISTTAMVLIILAWPLASRAARRAMSLGLGTLVAVGSGLRIAMGRHFLSDVVFSILICALVVAVVHRATGMDRFAGIGWRALGADLRSLVGPRTNQKV